MANRDELLARLMQKYGGVIDLQEHPEVLDDLVAEAASVTSSGTPQSSPPEPFGVPWMDSWVAHWVYEARVPSATERGDQVASALRALTDLKFNERIAEIHRFVAGSGRFEAPPDGGPPPEPGVPLPPEPPAPPDPLPPPLPPAGPGPIAFEPPDGGPPEPGPPAPAGPAVFEPPDGGPPEPGTPPAGPVSGFVDENPWILYWFVSLKAPLLLEVVDLHLTRRLEELGARRNR